jgi:hypothetical protein
MNPCTHKKVVVESFSTGHEYRVMSKRCVDCNADLLVVPRTVKGLLARSIQMRERPMPEDEYELLVEMENALHHFLREQA